MTVALCLDNLIFGLFFVFVFDAEAKGVVVGRCMAKKRKNVLPEPKFNSPHALSLSPRPSLSLSAPVRRADFAVHYH